MTYSGIVQKGDQYGRTLGFPTANLDAGILKDVEKEGYIAARFVWETKFTEAHSTWGRVWSCTKPNAYLRFT
ncbi:hypothetical protein IPL68_00305 [Candidatus Saccharibacteria bacterium]|nr:MAG: hypothetical protein IPL68_00305 [Candidatus Saccharibacteria bacterium]